MRRWTGITVLLAVVATNAPAVAGSLRDTLRDASRTVGILPNEAFDKFADAIANTAARGIPVVSASAGFTYRYDPELGIFERTSDTLGPVFLERPETLGRSKLNFNVSYQYLQFDEYDGTDLRDLENNSPILISSGGVQTPTKLEYSLGLHSHIVALSATYGVLDNLDVNLLLPLIQTNFDVGVTRNSAHGHVSNDAFGVGDVLLRLKYGLSDVGNIRSALGLQLRFPSGSEDDFQGTGDFEASPSFYAAMLIGDRVHPHLNAAIDLVPDEIDQSQARYGVGVDVDVVPRVGFSLAFLGRSEFSDSAAFKDTAFLHSVNGERKLSRLLGVNFGRKDFFDLSFGMRAVVWRNVMLFANGIYALNDDGLRNDTVIPTVGLEGTF